MPKMPLPNILKKASSYILGDGSQDSRPTLYQDGEVLFCKNNVCVHPPTIMRQHCDVVHHPGYLTVTCRFVKNATAPTLHLSWIPNSTLRKYPTTLENNLSRKLDGTLKELDPEYQRQISEESCDSRLDYDNAQGTIQVCLEVKEPVNCGDCERICSGGYSEAETKFRRNKVDSENVISTPEYSGSNCKINVEEDFDRKGQNGLWVIGDETAECKVDSAHGEESPVDTAETNNSSCLKSTDKNPISLSIVADQPERNNCITNEEGSKEMDQCTNLKSGSDNMGSEERKSSEHKNLRSSLDGASLEESKNIQSTAKSIEMKNTAIPKNEFDEKNCDDKAINKHEIKVWSYDEDSVKSRSMSLTSTCSLNIMATTDGMYICKDLTRI